MKVLLTYDMEPKYLAQLKEVLKDGELVLKKGKEITDEDVLTANVILGNPPKGRLHENADLGLVALNSAGSTDYCEKGVLPDSTVLTNATGAYGIIISEWMSGMILNIMNRFPEYRENQKEGLWKRNMAERQHIYGAKVLILGTGNIGSEFAKRMKAFGAVTIGVRRSSTKSVEFFDEIHLNSELDELIPEADIIAMCLPGTDKTAHIMSRERIFSMKKTAIIINVGRGTAIDTDALNDALREGAIAACGLDVTDPEPLPQEHPLWKAPNAYITPHISGGMNSPVSRGVIAEVAVNNVKAYLGQGEYRNVVDRETGYKISE